MPRKSTKTRAPHDILQTALRIPVDLHAQLAAAAKARRSTLNTEMAWRLRRTLDLDVAEAVQDSVRELLQPLEPYLLSAYERGLYSDCLFAARQLIDLINPLLAAGAIEGRTGRKARAAIENFHLARHNLERMFGENAIDAGNAESPEFQAAAEVKVRAAEGESARVKAGFAEWDADGSAEWPLDTFTRRRLADGSLKLAADRANPKEPPK
jgi:hypothetical protein